MGLSSKDMGCPRSQSTSLIVILAVATVRCRVYLGILGCSLSGIELLNLVVYYKYAQKLVDFIV